MSRLVVGLTRRLSGTEKAVAGRTLCLVVRRGSAPQYCESNHRPARRNCHAPRRDPNARLRSRSGPGFSRQTFPALHTPRPNPVARDPAQGERGDPACHSESTGTQAGGQTTPVSCTQAVSASASYASRLHSATVPVEPRRTPSTVCRPACLRGP